MPRRRAVKPFAANLEYLTATLDYLQALAHKRIVQRRIEALRSGDGRQRQSAWRAGSTPDAADSYPTSEGALQNALRRASRDADHKRADLNARTTATLEEGRTALPLEELARANGLCEFEKLVLALVLGPTLDHAFQRWIEEACDSRGVEIRSVLDILCETLEEKIRVRRYFIHTGKLLSCGLLNLAYSHRDIASEQEFMAMDLALPRQVSSRILGEYDIDDQLVTFSSVVDSEVELDQVVLPPGKTEEVLQLVRNRDDYLTARREWGFDRILSYGKGVVMLFSGPSGTGKTMLAHALARSTGRRLMLVDIRKIGHHSSGSFEENLQRIFHEARLQSAILFFDEADEMFGDRGFNSAMPVLLREFEKLDGIAILATNRRQVLDEALERRILYKLDFELPTTELREKIWRKHLPAEAPVAGDIDPKALAEEFEFSGGFIKNAVLVALQRALQRTGPDRRITQEDLREGARVQRRNRMEAHADKVVPKVGLSDVVLPGEVADQVRALVDAVRVRSVVYSEWGVGRKMNLGKAITALFSGESGTGKTMTAEAVAFELGQNLYPVNLASVLSAWVGQTEKHLVHVFESAREAQAILFFDEADSLFGARIRGGGHHGHYINQQINALLREIERFDGVVILATNRPDQFDPAFERRLRHRVHFPKPDPRAREAIWRGVFPLETPLADDVDFAALARDYEFTGGAIKNVALRAAFRAATNGRIVTQTILRASADEERPLACPEARTPVGFGANRIDGARGPDRPRLLP